MAIIPKRDDDNKPAGNFNVTLTKRGRAILSNLWKDLGEPTGTARERKKATDYVFAQLLELATTDKDYKAERAKEAGESDAHPRSRKAA